MSFDPKSILITAASIDELMSSNYQAAIGQKDSSDRAGLRLAAWCRSASSGDWGLFFTRLKRDGLSLETVIQKFSEVAAHANSQQPAWYIDAQWIYTALTGPYSCSDGFLTDKNAQPFEQLFYALVQTAESKVKAITSDNARVLFNDHAAKDLRVGLLKLLTELYGPLLYSKFVALLKKHSTDGKLPASAESKGHTHYDALIEQLRASELATIFADKPVLLRLTATITRQWIDTTAELINRLATDIDTIKASLTKSAAEVRVQAVGGDLSDPHNFGHSVQIITFEDNSKVVYKPKDLGLDIAWYELIQQFNASKPPVELKPVKTISCSDYGWTEFIPHTACDSEQDVALFYRRSGAWLAIFHLLASSDMHFENILAHGAHPVPIDLEMILQASTPEAEQSTAKTEAHMVTNQRVANSVLMVGMLPSYTKSPNNKVFDAGGLNAVKSTAPIGSWRSINTDGMRWMQAPNDSTEIPNVPHIGGQYAQLGDYLTEFIEGFEQYSLFLLKQRDAIGTTNILNPFRKKPVRKVIRNTRFYYMLLQRLKDHRQMGDGITWSAQADFLARLADWDSAVDLIWPLQAAERLALVNLNVPHFVSPSDEDRLSAITGHCTKTNAIPGLQRATLRFDEWCEAEIAHQVEIIRVSTSFVSTSDTSDSNKYIFSRKLKQAVKPFDDVALLEELSCIVSDIQRYGTVRNESAAWLGLDWLGDSEVGQLVTIGPDLYNGAGGIALFLSAYSRHTNDPASRELAIKAIAATRQQITQPSALRWVRGLGIGGASGLGSVVYLLTQIAIFLDDSAILADATTASNLFTNEVIASDRSLDIIGGSAGAILGLLALYRKTQAPSVLAKAIACGDHLLRTPRTGEVGQRCWIGIGMGDHCLTGFSHGAAGFAFALSALASASGRKDFAQAADECSAFETSCYNALQLNWPDLRSASQTSSWPSQWCHGAVGIGLARVAHTKADSSGLSNVLNDISNAVKNTTANWPQPADTLCCGTLGSIELLGEAGRLLKDPALSDLSDQRLAQIIINRQESGSYSWAGGTSLPFNLGLFRGLSGVGYTILRKLDRTLPNVLLWE
jgi:type 2 lantibiotic biosynthesis protein LanM